MIGTMINYPIFDEVDSSFSWNIGDTVKMQFDIKVIGLMDDDYLYEIPIQEPHNFTLKIFDKFNKLIINKTQQDMEADGIVTFELDEEDASLFIRGDYKLELSVHTTNVNQVLLNKNNNTIIVR